MSTSLGVSFSGVTDWLNDTEQQAWRGFVHMWQRLNHEFGSGYAAAGLSEPDFVLLVPLSEAPGGRMRPSDLAREVSWDKSRLSKHATRMERRGLIRKEDCSTDGRGAVLVLTPEGRAAIEKAAPHHVAIVRRQFIDKLTPADLRALARIATKINTET